MRSNASAAAKDVWAVPLAPPTTATRSGSNRQSTDGDRRDACASFFGRPLASTRRSLISPWRATRSLDIYALQEAEKNYRHALEIFDDHDACASSESVAAVVVRLLEAFVLEGDYRDLGRVTEKYVPLMRKAGESPDLVKALYYHGSLTLLNLEDLRESHRLMAEAHAIAERLGAGRARAYARYGLLLIRSTMGLDAPETSERMSAEMMEDSLRYGDNYIRNFSSWMVGQHYLRHGLF